MSPKKKKNVPSVTEPKQENVKEVKFEPVHVEVAPKEEAPIVDAKEVPQKLIEVPQIDEDTKRMLAKAGMNWDSVTQAFERVNIWAESVDARFNIILQKMPTEKGIADELVKRSLEERQKQMQQQPGTPASTGNTGAGAGGLGNILQMIQPFLGGGGSSEMQDKIMNMALESMGLGNALVKAIIIKTAPELAAQLIPPIVPKA